MFGKGVKDVELCPASRGWRDRLFPARSHTRYWHPLETHASKELVKALHLNEFCYPRPVSSPPRVRAADRVIADETTSCRYASGIESSADRPLV
jgi:hypothetical protein